MAGRSSVSASHADAPALLPLGHHTGKPAIPMHRPVTLIGSRSNARIHLTSSSVSKAHALVVRDGPITYIRDLSSRTRTYINGNEIRDAELNDGDLIKIGSFTFKFIAAPRAGDLPTSAPVAPASLEVSGSDLPVPIDGRVMLIGRRTSSDVHLLEESVSTAHAVIFEMDGQRHVRDLGSRTGTFVNGVKVHQHPLNPNDQIRLGETTLTYTPGDEFALDAPSEGSIEDVAGSALDLGASGATSAETESAEIESAEIESAETESADVESAGVASRKHDVAESAAPLDLSGIDFSTDREASERVDASFEPTGDSSDDAAVETETESEAPAPIEDAPSAPVSSVGRRSRTSPDSSAGKRDAGVPLSEAGEKLRPAKKPSETAKASVPSPNDTAALPADDVMSADDSAREEADSLPRRGWRPAAQQPAAPGDADHVADALAEKQTETTEDVLRFDDQKTSNRDDADVDSQDQGGTAVLDRDSGRKPGREPTREPPITAGSFTSGAGGIDENEPKEFVDDSLASDAQTLDIEPLSPEKEAEAADFLAELDLGSLSGGDASDSVVEPADASAEASADALADRPSQNEQNEPTAMNLGATEKPKRAGKRKKPEPAAPTERVAASRSRRKPKDSIPEAAPVDETPVSVEPASEKSASDVPAADVPVEAAPTIEKPAPKRRGRKPKNEASARETSSDAPAADEVIAETEPTVESALDLGSAEIATGDSTTIDMPPSEIAEVDALSDTGLGRAVQDLSGETGDIVEAPSDGSPAVESPAFKSSAVESSIEDVAAPIEATVEPTVAPNVSETSARRDRPARPNRPTAPAAREAAPEASPAWGANQENYLGGVPVTLPPLRPAASPFGQSQIKPTVDAPKPQDEANRATVDDAGRHVAALESIVADDESVVSESIADDATTDTTTAPAKGASTDATAAQLEAVNSLIDDMLAPPAIRPAIPPAIPPAISSSASSADADQGAQIDAEVDPEVDAEVDAEVDGGALSLGEPEAESPKSEPETEPVVAEKKPSIPAPPPMIPIPPPPAGRVRRGRRGSAHSNEAEHVPPRTAPNGRALRDDERIPPYTGAMPATRGSVTTGFDGLAMPPVREADVFAHMSPPVNDNGDGHADVHGNRTNGDALTNGNGSTVMRDPFSGLSAKDSGSVEGAGSALTPMDLVRPESDAPDNGSGRRPRRAGRPNPGLPNQGLPNQGRPNAGRSDPGRVDANRVDARGPDTRGPDARGLVADGPNVGRDVFFAGESSAPTSRRRASVRPVMPGNGSPSDENGDAEGNNDNGGATNANDPDHLGVDLAASSSEVPLDLDAGDARSRRRPPVVYSPTGIATPAARGDEASPQSGNIAARTDRKRRLRLVRWLFLSMFALAIGAGAACYLLIPVHNSVEATVTYRNFNAKSLGERKDIQDQQRALLQQETTRRGAIAWLRKHEPEVVPGFLNDVEPYLRVAGRPDLWSEGRRGTLLVRYDGNDADGDRWRVKAITASLVEQSQSTLAQQARDAKHTYEELQNAVNAYTKEQQDLAAEARRLQLQGDSAPDGQALLKLKADVAQLDRAWGDAVAAVKSAEAELARLKAMASKDSGTAVANGAKSSPADQRGSDDQVAQMETQLKDLSGKMTAAQSARAEQAQSARKALDDSMGEFEKQLTSARQVMNDSPELAAYVSAAQRLQETTRSLIDDLIRRQEQYYGRLNDYKTKLVEKMEQRRVQSLQQDPKLKELNERRDVATRQYNAAMAAGLKKDVDEKKSEVELLDSMIRAQQELLPKDPFYAEAIDQIQQIIDVTQKNIEDDRKRTESMLAQLQSGFKSSQSVEKMPEAQKSVAADLEKRLADINAARQTYNSKMTEAGAEDDDATKALRTQIASLQTSIDTRRKELADATTKAESELAAKSRGEAISSKEKELSDLQHAESDARLAYENKEKDFREASAAAENARSSQDRLLDVQRKKDLADRKLAQAQLELPGKKKAADEAVYPELANDSDVSDVRVVTGSDNRTMYAIISAGTILVGFAAWILMTLHGSAGGDFSMDLDALPRAAIPVAGPSHTPPVIEAIDTPIHEDDAEFEATIEHDEALIDPQRADDGPSNGSSDDEPSDGEDHPHDAPATL